MFAWQPETDLQTELLRRGFLTAGVPVFLKGTGGPHIWAGPTWEFGMLGIQWYNVHSNFLWLFGLELVVWYFLITRTQSRCDFRSAWDYLIASHCVNSSQSHSFEGWALSHFISSRLQPISECKDLMWHRVQQTLSGSWRLTQMMWFSSSFGFAGVCCFRESGIIWLWHLLLKDKFCFDCAQFLFCLL